MALRRAIGAVKDQTTIGLAKVGGDSLADLDVAIVKATSHDEYPAEEKYYREILSLTCYSRTFIASCVNTISRRLSRTRNWVVALKTLMLVQRLLGEGDPAYEQEIFFTTRRGTRMLNMSDFRDARSYYWDYSAFVRMYALYLDEKLEYKMHGKRRLHHRSSSALCYSYELQLEEDMHQQEQCQDNNTNSAGSSSMRSTAASDLTLKQMLSKIHHLQQLLERFLATRPTGSAKHNRIVIVALHTAVRESFQLYYEMTDILSILIDQFMEVDVPQCVKIHEIFSRVSKQFDELDSYYIWCKDMAVIRTSEYPEVERITPKKLDLMDEFIRDKASNARNRMAIMSRRQEEPEPETTSQEEKESEIVEDMNTIKALPPAEGFPPEEEMEQEPETKDEPDQTEADLLHLRDDAPTSEEHADKFALALFDGATGDTSGPAPPPIWEVFNDTSDWETALVQSASYLPHQKASLGGGFDTMLLDGMYQQAATNAALAANQVGGSGSASSVALGSTGNPKLLALPAPPSSSGNAPTSLGNVDPFAASLGVAPTSYVQMSELQKKQQRLIEEQLMWQQYQRDGMQGHVALSKIQQSPANIGGHGYGYNGYHYGY